MASAQYWRVNGIATAAGGDLELSELQLWGVSGRLDAGLTITSTASPVSGVMVALSDGVATSSVRFAAADVQSAGFNFGWDFGSAVTVVDVRPGGGTSAARFPDGLTLECLTGSEWSPVLRLGRYPYPGDATLGPGVSEHNPAPSLVKLLVHCDGTDGSTTFTDSSLSARTLTATGTTVATAQKVFGTGSALFSGSGSSISAGSGLSIGATDDFRIQFRMRPSAYASREIFKWYSASTSDGIGLDSSGRVHLWRDSIGQVVTSATVFSTETWSAIEISRTGGVVRLFIDGTLEASAGMALSLGNDAHPIYIGRGYYNTSFSGYLDEIRIVVGEGGPTSDYTVALTAFPDAGSTGAEYLPARLRSESVALSRARRWEFDGNGYISGTVKVLGDPTNVPTRRRVRLLRDRDAMLVAETWSDAATGAYLFNEIDRTATYTVLTDDYEHSYRSVVADRITPSLMS